MFGSFAASPAFKGVLYVIKMHKVMALGTIPGKGPSGKNPGVGSDKHIRAGRRHRTSGFKWGGGAPRRDSGSIGGVQLYSEERRTREPGFELRV